MPNFNHDRMLNFAIHAIQKFSEVHQGETFYGFSVDASLLCLNTEEAFGATLAKYRAGKSAERYTTDSVVEDLRLNTGDWEYQGFADLMDSGGFDYESYQEHYDSNETEQVSSDYAQAMDRLVRSLQEVNAFHDLGRTSTFFANRVEHDY